MRINFLCILVCWTASVAELAATGAVTYPLNAGRFGDNLLSLSHAAWFSYILDLPLVYQPFKYSDQLCLHDDPSLLQEIPDLPKQILHSPADYHQFYAQLLRDGKIGEIVLETPFYPESPYLFENRPKHPQFTQVDWQDPQFKARLRQWIAPKHALPKAELPGDKFTVALHYRTGEVYDKKKWKLRFPLKGPPDTFYIDAINHLKGIQNKPLYIYLFTDSPNPMGAKAKFESYFPDQAIEFACRTEGAPQENVLEDFFGLEGFDCLIRAESHFSMMASYLFSYKMIFSPVKFHWIDGKTIVVDQILLEYQTSQGLLRTIFRK